MTIHYNLSISTSRPWTFWKLVFRWDGSAWKSIWIQYLVWLILYFCVSFAYRVFMTPEQRENFGVLVDYLNARMNYMPISWMLGFFVTGVLGRFWYLYNIIGWMDNIALMVAMYVRGTDERARMYRRQIVRHCMLTQVLVFRDLSVKCRKRVPTLDTVQAAGFMSQHERDVFEEIQYRYAKYWVPFQWAWALSYNAWKEGYIESPYYQKVISDTIKKFRTDLAWLCNYDWVPLPMIYPTIVCFAVHAYFAVAIIARQFVVESKFFSIDLVFPFMTTIEFIFIMGWLKVAEGLLNPWGEDDDDFETNALIDRNLTMALKIVDDGYGNTPALAKDDFWDHEWQPMYPEDFDYTTQHIPKQSMADVKVKSSVHEIRMLPLHRERSNATLLSRVNSKAKIVPVRAEDEDAEHEKISIFHLVKPLMEQQQNGGVDLLNPENGGMPRKTMSVSHIDSLQPSASSGSGWSRLRRFSRSLLYHDDSQSGALERHHRSRSITKSIREQNSASSLGGVAEAEENGKVPIQRKESQILPSVTLVETPFTENSVVANPLIGPASGSTEMIKMSDLSHQVEDEHDDNIANTEKEKTIGGKLDKSHEKSE